MIRRSKIKVRPAIKKLPQGGRPSQSNSSKTSSPITSTENSLNDTSHQSSCAPTAPSVKANTADKKAAAPSVDAVNNVETPAPLVNAVDKIDSAEKAAFTATDNAGKTVEPDKEVEVSNGSKDDNVGTLNNENAAKPQVGRRRKLVACPTMARKRLKPSNSDQKVSVESFESSVSQEKVQPDVTAHATTSPLEGPSFAKVSLPTPAEPKTPQMGDGSGLLQENYSPQFATLTTVTNISLEKEAGAEGESSNQAFAVESTVSATSSVHTNNSSSELSRSQKSDDTPPMSEEIVVADAQAASKQSKDNDASSLIKGVEVSPGANGNNAGTLNSKNATKLQVGRRRKLVACPTTARKRLKPSNTDRKVDVRQLSSSVSQEKVQTATLLSAGPSVEKVLLPTQVESRIAQMGDGSGMLKENYSLQSATLSSVNSASHVEEEAAEGECNNQPFAGEAAGFATSNIQAAVNISSELSGNQKIDDMSPLSAQSVVADAEVTSEQSKKSDNTSLAESLPVEEYNSTVVHQNTVQKSSLKSKAVSATLKHRNSAMAKLKKLKQDQDDSKKWPELDQNVVSMSDLIFLNPPDRIGRKLGMNVQREDAERTVVEREKTPEPEPSTSTQEEEETALPVPQIRIAEDGSVVIDEESLVVDTRKPERRIAHKTVLEVGREGMVNQCSFLKRPHPRPIRWSAQETDKFYRCLCIVGAEFTLMGAMFRGRSADDLRRKFKRERKLNPNRVDNALMQQHLSNWTDDMFEPEETSDNGGKVVNVSITPEEAVK